MVTSGLPFRLMLPSLSTDTHEDFSSTYNAVDPTLVTAASTFTIIRSIYCSINGFLMATTTSARSLAKPCKVNVPGITEGWFAETVNTDELAVLKFTELIVMK